MVKRVKPRSRAIGVDPEEASCINEPINGRVTSSAFPTRRLSVDFSDVAEQLSLGDETLVNRVYRCIYQLSKVLLNANGDFPPINQRYRSRYDECKADRQF